MRAPGFNRRTRTFLLVFAQMALVAYLFQVAALDHWRVDPGHDVMGVADSAAHVAHCHGDAASCADSGGVSAIVTMDGLIRLPLPPAPHLQDVSSTQAAPAEAVLATPSEPPKAA